MQTRSAPPELRHDRTVDAGPFLREVAPLAGPTNGVAQTDLAVHDRYPRDAIARALHAPATEFMAERSSGPAGSGDHLVAIAIVGHRTLVTSKHSSGGPTHTLRLRTP